ncbi:MAG TPA: hypothetical protein VI603_16135 [Saprospiraceae bacterium]|nr:hypothetical protein [Saprospiraceae bacterium]
MEEATRETGYNFSGVDAPKNGNDLYGLRYSVFVVPLVKAVQEQQVMIEVLQAENAKLKDDQTTMLNVIQEKLQQMEAAILSLQSTATGDK